MAASAYRICRGLTHRRRRRHCPEQAPGRSNWHRHNFAGGRSPKKEGMYLYVLRKELPFADLPEDLLRQFGEPGHVMDLSLDKSRKLARVEVLEVMNALQEKGYYLQLPPVAHQYGH